MEDIEQLLRQLVRLWEHHEGSVGDTHGVATEYNSGFVDKKWVDDIKHINFMKVIYDTNHAQDVLKLRAGNYEIAGATNNPIGPNDMSWVEYHVYESEYQVDDVPDVGNRRHIFAVVNVSGDIYYRTVHSHTTADGDGANTGTKGWIKLAGSQTSLTTDEINTVKNAVAEIKGYEDKINTSTANVNTLMNGPQVGGTANFRRIGSKYHNPTKEASNPQGFAYIGNDIAVQYFQNPGGNGFDQQSGVLVKFNIRTGEEILRKPLTKSFHGNSMAYNPKDGMLYKVMAEDSTGKDNTHNKQVQQIDPADLTVKNTIELKDKTGLKVVHSIGYSSTYDIFIVADNDRLETYDSSWNLLHYNFIHNYGMFEEEPNYCQGIQVNGDRLYYIASPRDQIWEFKIKPDTDTYYFLAAYNVERYQQGYYRTGEIEGFGFDNEHGRIYVASQASVGSFGGLVQYWITSSKFNAPDQGAIGAVPWQPHADKPTEIWYGDNDAYNPLGTKDSPFPHLLELNTVLSSPDPSFKYVKFAKSSDEVLFLSGAHNVAIDMLGYSVGAVVISNSDNLYFTALNTTGSSGYHGNAFYSYHSNFNINGISTSNADALEYASFIERSHGYIKGKINNKMFLKNSDIEVDDTTNIILENENSNARIRKGVDTSDMVNDVKQVINDGRNIINSFGTVPDINTDVDLLPANIKQAVMDYRDTINMNSDTLRIAFLTDLHYQRGGSAGYAESSKDFSHLYALAGIADKVDLLVDNGDNIHGEYGNSTNILIKDNQEVIDYLYSIHPQTFVNIGNHDDGSVYNIAGHLVNQCLPDDVIMPLYRIGEHPFGEVRNGKSLYGYKDFPEYKIRVLIINDFENPDTAIDVNDGKYYTYQRARNQVITNEQIQFLKSTYESLPDDYQIVQFHHAPFVGNSGNGTGAGTWYQYAAPNHEVYEGMMNAFINSTSYSGSGTDELFPGSVSVDFTGKPKNRLIMDIVGHEHGDTGLNKKNGIPNIVRTCSIGYGRHDMYDENINNYLESYAFDVIEITPSTRTLNFNRFGGGKSLKVNY